MKNLNEAVIKLINEDVINGQKLIENELYSRLGKALEEKLVEFAPTVFTEAKKAREDFDGDGKIESPKAEWRGSRDRAIKKNKEDSVNEDYENLLAELEQLVEEIEAETGEELTESEIEEIADILLENYESGVDPDEEEEEIEEDSEEEYEDEE